MRVPFLKGSIDYKVSGQGPAIVFLHGFMESARIWRAFAYKLSSKFRVIRVNLPGHGKSSVYGEKHTMEFMAEAVHAVLTAERVETCMLVGHSMGGYVALAFAERWPETVRGLVLFSSVSTADTKERKTDRDRALKIVEEHKMKYISSVVPNLFYERTGSKAGKRIYKLVKLAARQPKEGIVAAIRGMRDRCDRTQVLEAASYPVLFLAGHDDPLIPAEKIQELAARVPGSRTVVMNECGHVGFIEQRKESMRAVKAFALEKFL